MRDPRCRKIFSGGGGEVQLRAVLFTDVNVYSHNILQTLYRVFIILLLLESPQDVFI